METKKKSCFESKMEFFKERCHKAGLRITPQRVAIYKALTESVDHPSAEVVYRKMLEQMPNISLDTVNRTLITLASIGVAFTVEGSGDSKRYDGNMESHQHFKCVKCKKIIDFHHEPFDNIDVPANIEEKFVIFRKTVYIEGLCKQCLEGDCNNRV